MSNQIDTDVGAHMDARPDARFSDRRVQRTRAALRSAFNNLILTTGYGGFSAADVAAAANVGRSTFYEHYRGKEDILAESLEPVLTPLADCFGALPADERLVGVIQHLWDNRKLARALLSGQAHDLITRQLARLIEVRLADNRLIKAVSPTAKSDALPDALVAAQRAAGLLALISEWLTGRHGCTAEEIAPALNTTRRSGLAQ